MDQFFVKELIATNRALNNIQSANLRTSITKKMDLRNQLIDYMRRVERSNDHRKINEMSDIVLRKGSIPDQQSRYENFEQLSLLGKLCCLCKTFQSRKIYIYILMMMDENFKYQLFIVNCYHQTHEAIFTKLYSFWHTYWFKP